MGLLVVAAPRSAYAFCRSTTNLDFVPTDEQACDTSGKPLFWPSRCVEVNVARNTGQQVDLATAKSLVATAVSTWSSAKCDACGPAGNPSLVVTEGAATDCAFGYSSSGPNTNVVIFRDTGWPHDLGTIALTTVSFRRDTGEIVDADMEIDSDPAHQKLSVGAPGNDTYDLPSILTHEFGHVMGLAHSADPEATMRPRYETGDTSLRDLNEDDVCGICAAAPPTREAPCSPTSAAACTPTNGTDPTTPGARPPNNEAGGCAIGHAASPHAGLALLALLGLSRLRSRNGRASRSRGSACTSCNR